MLRAAVHRAAPGAGRVVFRRSKDTRTGTEGEKNAMSIRHEDVSSRRLRMAKHVKVSCMGLACLLFAAAPALGAATPALPAATASTPTVALAMSGTASTSTFAPLSPQAEQCPEATAQAKSSLSRPVAATSDEKNSVCFGELANKLLEMAARKAGKFIPTPVLVF